MSIYSIKLQSNSNVTRVASMKLFIASTIFMFGITILASIIF